MYIHIYVYVCIGDGFAGDIARGEQGHDAERDPDALGPYTRVRLVAVEGPMFIDDRCVSMPVYQMCL